MEPTSLSAIQLAAIVAGYALAIARLTDAARPLWQWVKPPWLQTALPAVVTVMPDFAAALGLVKTKTDLVQAIVIALGALATAMRGALPAHVFERLPPEAKDDLREARKPRKDREPPTPRSGHPPVLPVLCFLLLVSCGAAQEPARCSETELAKIDAAFLAEATTACKLEGATYDDCKALPALREKYARLRKDWENCR